MEMREKYAKIVEIPFNSTNKYQVCGSGRPHRAGLEGGELEALQGLPSNLKVSFYLNIIGEMKPLSGCCWGSWRWGLKGKGEFVYTAIASSILVLQEFGRVASVGMLIEDGCSHVNIDTVQCLLLFLICSIRHVS